MNKRELAVITDSAICDETCITVAGSEVGG